ncbi:hypothetical protein A11Q_628 [Pseudobdellovibrio exovorus JSS]|uniref:Uncharacterized protein n=1 Tax=Pseudobdellovibrio exovorus JSS TaxID=1184267 RepID=M4V6L4_9BACT|nr:hypothetical protein A11Q_628 [Pseudobdellovibrio exovorus JSS]
MENKNILQNNKGLILIESLFLSVAIAGLLIIFAKLIEHHRQQSKKYHFSQTWSESENDKRSLLFFSK